MISRLFGDAGGLINPKPTFAFVTVGSGSYLGSTVRDLTLANILHRRGFEVVIYWMLEWNPTLADPGIRHRLLCRGTRYHFRRPSEFLDRVLGRLLFWFPLKLRVRVAQGFNGFVDRMLRNMILALCGTPDSDTGLARRLRRLLGRDKISHLMVSFASLGPLAAAAKRMGGPEFDYLLTFQGDEEFAGYARRAGVFDEYRRHLGEAVRGSRWPAVAVSHDYRNRLIDELGVEPARLGVLYNGVEFPRQPDKPPFSTLRQAFPDLIEGIPIVAYVGRQDVEKGVDLLLYAVKLLRMWGMPLQLAVCGATAKGGAYRKLLTDLAGHLGVTVHHAGAVAPEVRDALYAHSRCAVCPSVNREPFGLVVAEALSHGIPVIVPDYGGVTEIVRDGGRVAGLTFTTWDSGDLARKIRRLLMDDALHRELSANARGVAARFTAERMTDRLLAHLGLAAEDRQADAGGLPPADLARVDPRPEKRSVPTDEARRAMNVPAPSDG